MGCAPHGLAHRDRSQSGLYCKAYLVMVAVEAHRRKSEKRATVAPIPPLRSRVAFGIGARETSYSIIPQQSDLSHR